MKLKKGIKDLVEEAKAVIETIPLEDAIALHGEDRDDVIFVDIRDVRELEKEGMIPGAIHAPRGMIEFWVDPESPYHKEVFSQDDKTFVLYCRSSWRSALASKVLREMGMNNIKDVDKGFMAWKDADGPVGERPKKKAG